MPFHVEHPNKPDCTVLIDSFISDEVVRLTCTCGWEAEIVKGPDWHKGEFMEKVEEGMFLVRDHFDLLSDPVYDLNIEGR